METYIERGLRFEDKTISERACLANGGVIVVLAEPGAGKTELLTSFAKQFDVQSVRASIFRHKVNVGNSAALIIDALDEVARQDQSAVDAIMVKAVDSGATTIVLASRSSEWGSERNRFLKDHCGIEPNVVRLLPLDEHEQRALFNANFRGEDFDKFRTETDRFELAPLLGNPMFLKLFAEAYIQGDRFFSSKKKIFRDAIDRLAGGDGKSASAGWRPPIADVVSAASEIHAKILLSGATGVSTKERLGDRDFPFIAALGNCVQQNGLSALNSRLFKPLADADLHEPVHRIVAEYCAAHYLARRIDDPADRLSLRRSLSVIAPNAVVRDELRGLLGWLAALGSKAVQEAAIKLDPYAVLANGDPAQLTRTSKQLLLRSMRQLSEVDPYFRRSDAWRKFNVAGFFTTDVGDEVKLLLAAPSKDSHLQDLILELLEGSEAAISLIGELRALMLAAGNDVGRLRARRCLAWVPNYDPADDFVTLVNEGSNRALAIAAKFITDQPAKPIERQLVLMLLRRLGLPPTPGTEPEQRNGSRYFIRELTSSFSLGDTTWFLDQLTEGLSCTCSAQKSHECHCRAGASKIIGRLLDRYFELAVAPHDPLKIWSWTRKLKFEREGSAQKGRAVTELQRNSSLRQSIHALAFKDQKDADQIWQTILRLRWGELHDGLQFMLEDLITLADYSFETDNVTLWMSFAPRHNQYAKVIERDRLRTHMRAQAREKATFMREWAKRNRDWRRLDRDERRTWGSGKRFQRRDDKIKQLNFAHLRAHREIIEQGRHWGWNRKFAQHYLHFPDKLVEIVDDVETAERALKNCIPSLIPHIPTLGELARREKEHIAEVLHASCLVRFRSSGSLDDIDIGVLRAVKTDAGHASAYREGEAELFEAEIDTRIFQSVADIEDFAREYIEPTVMNPAGTSTNLWWLENKTAWEPIRPKLAAEWLERYPDASLETIGRLFDTWARSGNKSDLIALVQRRCDEMIAIRCDGNAELEASRRKFWFLRHFFFASCDRDGIWATALSNPDDIFDIERRAGRYNHDEAKGWPALSAEKVHRILDAYVGVWPKVFLPNSWGSGSPKGETAYRFLADVVWRIERDDPDRSIATIDRMLPDSRFSHFHADLRSMKASATRRQGLRDFVLPTPTDIVALLDKGGIASVEDMRALLVEELQSMQDWLRGAETDPLVTFYPGGKRTDENTARNRIVERLQGRMTALNSSVVIEHHMADSNRCDFTASASIEGRRLLLVIEVKGQWHAEIFSAAATQLSVRYASHPDAASQGIFLALWFGPNEKVAGKKNPGLLTASDLRNAIVQAMPASLLERIDVFVLDLSRHSKNAT